MKRTLKISVGLIIASFLITPVLVNADYQVTVGQIFDYDILDASVKFTMDGSSASSNGFTLGDQAFTNGSQISVEVLSVIANLEIQWNVSCGSAFENGTSTLSTDFPAFLFMLFYPLPLYDLFGLMTFSQANSFIAYGLGLILLPFWDPSYFGNLYDFVSESAISGYSLEDPYKDTTFQGSYSITGGVMTFEWFMGGLMDFSDDDVQPAKYNFNHQMKMVYDLATGVLQGFRMESFIDGKNNGKDIILELGYLCEIEGYNMPDFNFTPLVFAPGFEWFITLSALGVLAIPIVIRKFRK
ncbi:MAG TPA: choice-of-anchor S family protein [Candidatus Bathyarchaeia archaeon]|nr:choice-of-anchor S family protein [Candidatus Bathyarchaeia archaeon]